LISINKLARLPRKTRLRKTVLLLQAEERELAAGREPREEYLRGLCGLIVRHEAGDAELAAAAEACNSACTAGGSQPSLCRRRVNSLRHALLRHLGAEPAEWDLLDPASAGLDGAARRVRPFRAYLEEIRSPFNVGSIFRSCEAFGVCELLLAPATASPLHPRAVKSARGAVAVLPWRVAGLEELAALESREGIFALELGGLPLEEFPFPRRGTMLIGSEELGLSPEGLALAGGGRVSVPMAGAKRSLNVAVAAGIVLQAWYASTTER
jgi:TrmH family RNA methyltransferase